jgi:fumarate reductase subunit D
VPSIKLKAHPFLSLFLAALCTPIIILIWGAVRHGISLDHGYADAFRSTIAGFLVYGIASEAAAFLLGLPTLFLYRKLNFSSWPLYALGGVLVSLIASVVLTLTGTLYFLTGQPARGNAWADAAPLFVLCGAVSASSFWLMSRSQSI